MTITARYPGRCAKCGGAIKPGEQIDWDKSTKATTHIECPQKQEYDGATYRLDGGSGYGCDGWRVGEVVQNSKRNIEAGEPEVLVVLEADSRYIRYDGLSFGVGDDRGYIYTAVCREATAEEAAPLLEKRAKAEARSAAGKRLRQIAQEVQSNGEYPEGQHEPEGETVNIGAGRNIYGGGAWFTIGTDHIWYIRNNGMDGDNWGHNNVRTGGAGAIGYRVEYDAELASEIRTLAETAQ